MTTGPQTARPPQMRSCSNCVYPQIAVFVTLEDDGVCSGCRVSRQKPVIDWNERGGMLREILEHFRSKDGSTYDCIIPVSGGKDSYFQTHVIKNVYGMNPLLVTYHGNNYLPEGQANLDRMRHVFGVDHLIFRPGVELIVKMNRAGFKVQGDMNWHAHCGISTYPVQMPSSTAFPCSSGANTAPPTSAASIRCTTRRDERPRAQGALPARLRLERHVVGVEGIDKRELQWARYPSDEELEEVGVRQIHLGNYVHWDANIHSKLVVDRYQWEPARQPFERTYRMFSNLDDMHENGIHDYLKFVKFGYGRATDHSSKDIRAGHMTREQGVAMVRRYDHVKSRRDLDRWLGLRGHAEARIRRDLRLVPRPPGLVARRARRVDQGQPLG